MESELARQAEILFGEPMVRKLRARAREAEQSVDDPADKAATMPPSEPAEGAAVASAPALQQLRMTGRQERRLWRHVQTLDRFWETLEELEPGLIARLSALAAAHRWEVIFLTKRPETVGPTAQVQTQRWLESKGFTLPSVYVVQGSRGRIAAALGLDIVVDDRPENCLDVVVDSSARAILVRRDEEKHLPTAARRLGIGVVKSVGECLEILAQLDAPAAAQPGVMDRVKRMLGLSEPARV